MSLAPLACTVRECGLLLEPEGGVLRCTRGHTYDVARSGYVNLLQPQDRRALNPGDSREAVTARARLLSRGIGRHILETLVDRVATLDLPAAATVADLGSGTGDTLAALTAARVVTGIGIDLSSHAIDYAARHFPRLTWVVANADRRLPLLDRSVDLVLSVHGRRNPAECARVLTRTGVLVVTVPAPDDLAELRELVLGRSIARARLHTVGGEHSDWFEPADQWTMRERQRIDRDGIRDLLRGTYRGARFSAANKLASLDGIDVTLASEVLLLRRR